MTEPEDVAVVQPLAPEVVPPKRPGRSFKLNPDGTRKYRAKKDIKLGARGHDRHPRESTPELKTARIAEFLKYISGGASITTALANSKLSANVYKAWKEADPEGSAAAMKEAYDAGTDRLEDQAYERSMHGTKDPVFQQGELVGYRTILSDNLMQRVLAARRPQLYRQQLEHVGKDGAPITANDIGDLELARRLVFLLNKGESAHKRLEMQPVDVVATPVLESSSSSTA